jgi:hypothetical protein
METAKRHAPQQDNGYRFQLDADTGTLKVTP